VFSFVAVSSLLAGLVEHAMGWRAVNLALLLPGGLVALAIAAHLRAERASKRPAV
jgi:hypothetical protein